MRLLFASPIGALGGAELFLLEILQELREQRPEWELHLVSGSEGALLERAAACGVTCHSLPFPPAIAALGEGAAPAEGRWLKLGRQFVLIARMLAAGSDVWAYRRRFRRLLRSIDPDLVHSNGLKFHLMTGLSGCGRARLVWFLHDYIGSRGLLRHVLPRVSRRVSCLLANSRSVAEDARPLFPAIPVEVAYCGIDLERFRPGIGDGATLDRLAGREPLPKDGVRIGLVATYARWKGQDVFLEAAAHVQERLPALSRYYIVGGPIYQTRGSQFSADELSELARQLGIDDHVALVPFQQNVDQVFRSLDVVVHASRQLEPFGRTVLEAMACGRAVIAVNAGGSAEIFESGRSALGIPPNDVTALAEAMERLIGDADLRDRLGREAALRARQFSRRRLGEQLAAVYEREVLPRGDRVERGTDLASA